MHQLKKDTNGHMQASILWLNINVMLLLLLETVLYYYKMDILILYFRILMPSQCKILSW